MQRWEVDKLMSKGKEDGAKLYTVADALHKLTVTMIVILAIVGLIVGFAAMQNAGFVAGVVVFALVGVLCLLLYAFDVIITNTLKVLVHILNANLVVASQHEAIAPPEASNLAGDNKVLSPRVNGVGDVVSKQTPLPSDVYRQQGDAIVAELKRFSYVCEEYDDQKGLWHLTNAFDSYRYDLVGLKRLKEKNGWRS